MKGPGLRLRNDVRRCWKCPETGNLLKTPGSVTHLYSPFVKQTQWMKLEEDEPIARKQITLQEILERMVIVVPEEEEEEAAPKTKTKQEPKPKEESKSQETAQEKPSDEQPASEDSKSK